MSVRVLITKKFKATAMAVALFTLALGTCTQAVADAPYIYPTVTDSIAHPQDHFTQGLFFDGKELIETTGLYGNSGMYRWTMDGKILDSVRLDKSYFGEGSVSLGEDIFYLTWREGKAFIYNRKPFKPKGEFSITTEGWGLTLYRDNLLMSNGSSELILISPRGFYATRVIPVRDGKRAVNMLNELEMVDNVLYANIWQTDLIAVIDLPSGKVLKYLDFSKKVAELRKKYPNMDVLNGIAYDGKDLWITGKNWPWIYKMKDFK